MSKYSFDDFCEIIHRLRDPENGCPWDKVQTHETLRRYLIEEAYEAADAIDTGNGEKMADELGDVLLQIVLHAEIGKEENSFDIGDVIDAVSQKMITRHPHIFSDAIAETPDAVLQNWDEIKKKERGQKSVSETMESITRALPNLTRAEKIQEKAAKVGFDWENIDGAMAKVDEELCEFKSAIRDNSNIKEELGDLLFAIVNVSRFLNLECEDVIGKANEKFIKRFKFIEEKACKMGKTLVQLGLEDMDELWNESKSQH